MPSLPQASLDTASAASTLVLNTDHSAPVSGESVILTATAGASVTGTASAIEIFDQTTATLAGACMQSSRCLVAYSASAGVHSFAAFITPPAPTMPPPGAAITSNAIQVSWLAVDLKTSVPAAVGASKPVKLVATTSVDVAAVGFALVFWDATTGSRLTFCSSGTSCTTMLSEPVAGSHDIVAFIGNDASATPTSGVISASGTVSPTWLSVALSASSTYPHSGGTVHITATASSDLTNTPWSVGILDSSGNLVDKACKTGSVCTAQVTLGNGPTPFFSAVIGQAAGPVSAPTTLAGQLLRGVTDHAPLVNIQAKSASVQPNRILWGVDSCKPLTGDAGGGSGQLPKVNFFLGMPDFWGRYLTNTGNCPGISAAEVAAATKWHIGILPIYNDYDCSAVAGYDTGKGYGSAAAAAAASLHIPKGIVLVIDIEPPGQWCSGGIDAPFVEGWYDGISAAGYAPGYYGDGTASSTFGQAWCAAIADRSEIANDSFLWSFEPSLLGSYNKVNSPQWQPNQVGCAGNMVAWQYELSSGSDPDVDHDEALSKLPLWFP
ncbi:MAG TPA: glycoside hydrolase domain-containing protein [Candidatus Dormibacteraeota bacterium]